MFLLRGLGGGEVKGERGAGLVELKGKGGIGGAGAGVAKGTCKLFIVVTLL